MYRPREIAQRLGISPATLRLWSNRFDFLLSDAARRSTAGEASPAQRRYTDSDLQQLLRVKGLLAAGLTYEESRRHLASPPPEPNRWPTETSRSDPGSETEAGPTSPFREVITGNVERGVVPRRPARERDDAGWGPAPQRPEGSDLAGTPLSGERAASESTVQALQETLAAREKTIEALEDTLAAREKTIEALKDSLQFFSVYLQALQGQRLPPRPATPLLSEDPEEMDEQDASQGEPEPTGRPWWKRLLAPRG